MARKMRIEILRGYHLHVMNHNLGKMGCAHRCGTIMPAADNPVGQFFLTVAVREENLLKADKSVITLDNDLYLHSLVQTSQFYLYKNTFDIDFPRSLFL